MWPVLERRAVKEPTVADEFFQESAKGREDVGGVVELIVDEPPPGSVFIWNTPVA
jgi:hypothetical protein